LTLFEKGRPEVSHLKYERETVATRQPKGWGHLGQRGGGGEDEIGARQCRCVAQRLSTEMDVLASSALSCARGQPVDSKSTISFDKCLAVTVGLAEVAAGCADQINLPSSLE